MARELTAFALALALVACGGGDSSAGTAASGEAVTPAGAPLASKPFYRLDRGPQAACASGSTCEARLVLTALGDYHVNKEYPFKFVGDPVGTTPIDGQGTFAFDGEKRGTMTVKFKPAAPGAATLVGTFKLSVCNEDNCEIESLKLEIPIPVS
jgi:hypothetical protein